MIKKITFLFLVVPISVIFAQNKLAETNSDSTKFQKLEEVQFVRSKNSKQTFLNSVVPIDIINGKDVTTQSGKISSNLI